MLEVDEVEEHQDSHAHPFEQEHDDEGDLTRKVILERALKMLIDQVPANVGCAEEDCNYDVGAPFPPQRLFFLPMLACSLFADISLPCFNK